MDLSDYEAPRVLVTCRSQSENGVSRVEYWTDYDNDEDPIPFRRRVFPSSLDGEHITSKIVEKLIDSKSFDRLHDDDAISLCCVGILQLVFLGVEGRRIVPDWILRLANDRVGWDKYPWGSYVWPTLYSQLKDANVRRWPSLYASQPIDQVDKKTYSIFGFTWAFKGNLPVARLTPDDIEARSEWWVSSRANFDGAIDQAERGGRSSFQTPTNNSFLNMGTLTNWKTPIPSQPGPSNWQSQMAAQSATPFMQLAILSHPGTYNWQS
ncbi:hypothetical protein Tco_0972252 [Tanacetum coccineum]